MWTNELLEEKYKSQKQLLEKAEQEHKDYLDVIEQEVCDLYAQYGWKRKMASRKGMYINSNESDSAEFGRNP